MVDQLNGTLFDHGPKPFLHAPHLKNLATNSVCFPTCYTASPLCAPGRASFMSGQLPSRTRVYDNAAEFASSIPTYAHHLRRHGYHTILAGKMHYVGPDQLHGFETRTTTDIYPADFGWTPDYRKPGERIDWWYHNLGSVTGAGVAEISNQMEYDDEVAHSAVQTLYQLGRREDDRPWCLTVSFTHPHDPYVARRRYWDLYEDCDCLMPRVPALDFADHDPHSQRLCVANHYKNFDISNENIRRSRRAYFANISYLDDKIGEVLDTLERTRQEAIILSMTKKERVAVGILNASRRKRIAAGSGTSVQDVNKLVKQYQDMARMMKKLGGKTGAAAMKAMMGGGLGGGLGGGMGGAPGAGMPDLNALSRGLGAGGLGKGLGSLLGGGTPSGLPGLGGKPSGKKK